MAKNQFWNWEKFKTAKNVISRKNVLLNFHEKNDNFFREVDLFDFTSFFLDFFNLHWNIG